MYIFFWCYLGIFLVLLLLSAHLKGLNGLQYATKSCIQPNFQNMLIKAPNNKGQHGIDPWPTESYICLLLLQTTTMYCRHGCFCLVLVQICLFLSVHKSLHSLHLGLPKVPNAIKACDYWQTRAKPRAALQTPL